MENGKFAIVEVRSAKPEGLEIFKQVTKQKQTVLNLETGVDDEIEVLQCKFVVPDYNEKIHGNLEDYNSTVFEAAKSLVQPAAEQANALIRYAESKVYSDSKKSALAGGNFMTQDLKTQLIKMLRMRPAFAENTAKEIFDRWSAGFAAKNPNAVKYLADARTIMSAAGAEDEGF